MSTACFLIVKVFGVFICTKKLCIGFQIITNAIFNLTIVQFVIIIINMGKVVSSHFNPCEQPCVMSNHVLAHVATMGSFVMCSEQKQ
jgi:hypothetical protein